MDGWLCRVVRTIVVWPARSGGMWLTVLVVLAGGLAHARQVAETRQPAPAAPPSRLIAPPTVAPEMPPLPARTDPMAAVSGSSGPARVVNTRLLPPPPKFTGPRISIKHVIEGEAAKLKELEKGDGRPRSQQKPGVPRSPIGPRGTPGAMFPGSDAQSSPFIPPDPTLAVGANHVIMTANSLLSVWQKDGTLVQETMLFGSSGLFGSQNAGGFVFDPKCLYDAIENRFVVVALEYYEANHFSSILIALSQPGDPQSWTTFRTDSTTNVPNVGDAWFDYPGFGYDENCYYVTGNLFTFGDFASFRGVKFRCFDKQKLINGTTTNNFKDVDDFSRSFSSVQASQHFGASPNSYFVSVAGTSTRTNLQIHAVKNPLTESASRVMKIVTLEQSYSDPDFIAACCEDETDPDCGAGFINTVDDRVFNATWRGGNLYTSHHFTTEEGVVTARWYQVATNNWPTNASAFPEFVQGGDISGGTSGDGRPIHTFFPAIHVNDEGEVGVVIGMAVDGECAQVGLSGRLPSDPIGAMADPISVKSSDGKDQDEFRWGDYYGIALDPVDGKTFWAIGQYNKQFLDLPGDNDGWGLWIFSFDVSDLPSLFAIDDGVEQPIEASAGQPIRIDVLANDYDSQSETIVIDTHDLASGQGGTVELSSGTGPDGRDELLYTSATLFEGQDTFSYTIRNTSGDTDSAVVHVNVTAGGFRDPDDAGLTESGIDVSYYVAETTATDFPSILPAPYQITWVPSLTFPQAEGVPFANSGRDQGTAAVFTGFLNVPQQDTYEFCLLRGSGASLFIGDDAIIDDSGVHIPADGPICGPIGLKAGTHRFRVEFFHATGPHGLMLKATGGGLNDELVPSTWYLRAADCTADFDNTGFVDIDDYAAFVAAFELGDQIADVDGSGFVDTDDFDYFVCAFIFGCDCG